MTATNVQGAIDELYNVCFPPKTGGDWVLDEVDIVTSGDGLYEDEYEDGKYTYKGANPNNYITFNNEKAGWRIISVECDGTIKIIKDESIDTLEWNSDRPYTNKWDGATLNTYLNETYYNSLNETARNQIQTHDFSIGEVGWGGSYLQGDIEDENHTKWQGNIALATKTEYLRTNSNKTECETEGLMYNSNTEEKCASTNWLYKGYEWWLLTYASSDSAFTAASSSGSVTTGIVYFTSNVRPVIYLKPSIKISGDGTESNPYTLS